MQSLISKLTGKGHEEAEKHASDSHHSTTDKHSTPHTTSLTSGSAEHGSLKTTRGLDDAQHSHAIATGGEADQSIGNRFTSNFGGAKTGDYGGAEGNPKPEYNRIGALDTQLNTPHDRVPDHNNHPIGVGGVGVPAHTSTHTSTHTHTQAPTEHLHSHSTNTGNEHALFDSAKGASVGGGITGGSHVGHSHSQGQGVGDRIGDAVDRATDRQGQGQSYGSNLSSVTEQTHSSHSHHTSSTGGSGQALFDSAAGASVGGGISGSGGSIAHSHGPGCGHDLGAEGHQSQHIPGAAQGGGFDGAGEGYHDRAMGAEMGNYYKGQAGK